MRLLSRAAAAVLVLASTSDAGAVITGLLPQKGSLLGGTRVVVFGSGFGRDGKQGQTTVYVGNDVCTAVEYDSGDDKITCYTPPAPTHTIQAAAASFVLDVRVAIVTVGEPSAYAACPSRKCTFAYQNVLTPYLEAAVLGGSAGSTAYFSGLLFGDTVQSYNVAVGSPQEKTFATCDVSEEVNGIWADDMVAYNGWGVVSDEARDVGGRGTQNLRGSFSGVQRSAGTRPRALTPDSPRLVCRQSAQSGCVRRVGTT